MNTIYITLKPLAAKIGISHRTLEKIIVREFKKGNIAPRYQLPHVRSYIYIFEEFLPWFKSILTLVDKSKKIKSKHQPVDLFKHQKKMILYRNNTAQVKL